MGEPNPEEMQEVEMIGEGVVVMADTTRNPVTVSVWDGMERVHEPVAALQKDSIIWWAEGYKEAKDKYEDNEE